MVTGVTILLINEIGGVTFPHLQQG